MTSFSTPSRLQFHAQILAQLEERAHCLRAAQTDALTALQSARQVYDDITNDLNDVDARMHSIRETVRNLEKQVFARAMQAFPDELLRLVFCELAANLHNRLEWGTPSKEWPQRLTRRPFCLSAVCQRWRRVALDVSSLWSMITFRYKTANDTLRILSGLTIMLERSKKAPLDIFMDLHALDWSNVANNPVFKINAAIQKCSVRWRRYFLVVPNSLSDESFFDNYRYPTERLEEFSMESSIGFRSSGLEGFPLYLTHCPKLKKLRADRYHDIRTRLFSGRPPLETLALTCSLPSAVMWQILGLTPDLIRLELSVSSFDGPEITAPMSTLVFPRLQHLECSSWAVEYLQIWADHLRLPVLSSVAIYEADSTILERLLSPFKDTLTSLLYDLDGELNERHAEAIAELSNLKHLTIDAYCAPQFLLYLAEHGSLPALETLSFAPSINFQHNPDSDAIAEALVHFVRQRNTPVVQDAGAQPLARPIKLQRIVFDYPAAVPHWVDAQLLHLLPQMMSSL